MHGLPGAGKSFVALQLAEAVGAVRLRSDVERKRLHGLQALDDSRDPALYSAEATRRTYERLAELARDSLAAGFPTIVDAAFLRRDERRRFAELADEMKLPWHVLHCEAEPAVLAERISARLARGDDPSQADLQVLQTLRAASETLAEHERMQTMSVDTAGAVDVEALARWWCPPGHALP